MRCIGDTPARKLQHGSFPSARAIGAEWATSLGSGCADPAVTAVPRETIPMKKSKIGHLSVTLALALLLLACESSPTQLVSAGPPKAELQFVDLQGFDRDLTTSLSTPLPRVNVAFYDRVVPSALPERLQHWMKAVEAGGGSVKVVPPKSDVTAKSPFLLISAISSIWSASKLFKDMSTQAQFKAASAFNAEIILKRDESGEAVIDTVVFLQKPK